MVPSENTPDEGNKPPVKEKKKKGWPEPIPKAIREAALQRVMMGESHNTVAKSIGVSVSTVSRWCKVDKVVKGSALRPDVGALQDTPDEFLAPFEKHLKNQQMDEALSMFMKMQDGVEDKYRVMMAQRLFDYIKMTMACPPPVKNWSDLEKAHKIMSSILGIDGRGSSSTGRTKVDIQFEVVGAKPTVIDAHVVKDAEEEQSGD